MLDGDSQSEVIREEAAGVAARRLQEKLSDELLSVACGLSPTQIQARSSLVERGADTKVAGCQNSKERRSSYGGFLSTRL